MENLKIVEEKIKELNRVFNTSQNYFFNEHDFHHHFFNIVYTEFKKTEKQDLLHPEYPTLNRLILLKDKKLYYYELTTNKGIKRGHYDFVILSQKFFDNYQKDFEVLSNKTIGIISHLISEKMINSQYLDIAIEFKYFSRDSITKNSINLDITKLKLAKEAKYKCLAIFVNPKNLGKTKNILKELNKKDVKIFLNGKELK